MHTSYKLRPEIYLTQFRGLSHWHWCHDSWGFFPFPFSTWCHTPPTFPHRSFHASLTSSAARTLTSTKFRPGNSEICNFVSASLVLCQLWHPNSSRSFVCLKLWLDLNSIRTSLVIVRYAHKESKFVIQYLKLDSDYARAMRYRVSN